MSICNQYFGDTGPELTLVLFSLEGGRKYIKIGWLDRKFLSSYQFYQLIHSHIMRSQIALIYRGKV